MRHHQQPVIIELYNNVMKDNNKEIHGIDIFILSIPFINAVFNMIFKHNR